MRNYCIYKTCILKKKYAGSEKTLPTLIKDKKLLENGMAKRKKKKVKRSKPLR